MMILIVLDLFVIIFSENNEIREDKYTYMHISFICTNRKLVHEYKLIKEVIDKIEQKEENYLAAINKVIVTIMDNFFNKIDYQIIREYLELKKEHQEKNLSCVKISNINNIFQNLSIENLSLTGREKDFLEYFYEVQIYSEEKYKKERKIILENEEKFDKKITQRKNFSDMTWAEALYAYKLKIIAFSILIGYFIYSAYFLKPDYSFLRPKNEIQHDNRYNEANLNPIEEKGELISDPSSPTVYTSKHKVN